ncbi:MAG: glycoside hydrolase domain-containing protein [Kibdelosporangium sp.]
MAQVLDYSAGFPGAAAIRSAGYLGAVRYIGFPDRVKCTTAGEFADFSTHQLGMALVYQDGTGDWLGGYGGGQTAARRARSHADAIGFPQDRPIYFAVDRDVVTAAEFNTVVEYLRGASTGVGGVGRTGVYGEHDVTVRARQSGVASYFWQCRAWSGTPVRLDPQRHLYQHVGTVYVNRIAADFNDVLNEDWGQHNYVSPEEEDGPMRQLFLGKNVYGPDVWVGDGMTRRQVADVEELDGLRYLIGLRGGDNQVHDIGDLRVLGLPVEPKVFDVDEAALAAELAERGIDGISAAEFKSVATTVQQGGRVRNGTP